MSDFFRKAFVLTGLIGKLCLIWGPSFGVWYWTDSAGWTAMAVVATIFVMACIEHHELHGGTE